MQLPWEVSGKSRPLLLKVKGDGRQNQSATCSTGEGWLIICLFLLSQRTRVLSIQQCAQGRATLTLRWAWEPPSTSLPPYHLWTQLCEGDAWTSRSQLPSWRKDQEHHRDTCPEPRITEPPSHVLPPNFLRAKNNKPLLKTSFNWVFC